MSRRRGARPTRGWMVIALMTTVVGCAPEYSRVSISKRDGESGSLASATGLRLREGEVMLFEAEPRSPEGRRTFLGFEDFQLRAIEPNVAVVRPSILTNSWVVSGVRIGTTTMEVRLEGEVVDTVPIEVEE